MKKREFKLYYELKISKAETGKGRDRKVKYEMWR